MTYARILKRIRSRRTNYHKRAALLIGRRSFITIRISDQNILAQILKPTRIGDMVIASVHSRELINHGWKGSLNSLPACYLTGLLLGIKSLKGGTTEAILYTGMQSFTTRVAACLKGLVTAGINIPASEKSFPPDHRIRGGHIAEYAKSMLPEYKERYNTRFSFLLKQGLKPEDYPSHFEEIKMKISDKAIGNTVRELREENAETEEKSMTSTKKEIESSRKKSKEKKVKSHSAGS